MRKDGINKIQAKGKKVILSKKNLKKFEKLMNRRDIRKGKVNKLCTLLEKGNHFETPLMTNIKNGKERLIDGNHRMEAIEKYLGKNPERKVESWIFYYENLTEEQERKIYTKWNLGTKQTTNDFVKQYWDTFPIVKIIEQNGFPWNTNYVWTSKAIEFKLLISSYLNKNDKIFRGFSMNSAIEFIEQVNKLKEDDYYKIRSFLKEYMAIFGNPDRRNTYYRPTIFSAMFRIWLDNLEKSLKEIKNSFIKLRGHERIIYFSQFGGTRDICIQCRKDLLNVINGNRTKNLFV